MTVRRSLAFLAVVAGGCSGSQQAPPPATLLLRAKLRATLVSTKGSTLKHSFTVQNPDAEANWELHLQGRSCGCMSKLPASVVVPAGGSTAIAVEVSLPPRTAEQRLVAVYATKEPGARRQAVRFELECATAARLETVPEKLPTIQVGPRGTGLCTFDVVAWGDGAGDGSIAIDAEPNIKVEIDSPKTTRAHGLQRTVWPCTLTVSSTGAQATGERNEAATLTIRHSSEKVQRTLYWRFVGAVVALPSRLFLDARPDKRQSERRILLRGDRPFFIAGKRSSSPALTVKLPEPRPRTTHIIEVAVDNLAIGQFSEAEICLTIDHPEQKEVRIPIYVLADAPVAPSK